MVPKEIVQQQG